ncbi:hypothetical protein ACHQM5_012029 [Ranunculus cassubicifolius]
MESMNKFHVSLIVITLVVSSLETHVYAGSKAYAVYFGGHPHGPEPTSDELDKAENLHHEFLESILGHKDLAKDAMIYSHAKHINAFSAMLEPEQVVKISEHDDVASVFECKKLYPKTTRSWEFLGLEEDNQVPSNSLWKKTNFGANVIIGNMDSGAWPRSESFRDDGMGPIPSKWKGRCTDNDQIGVSCNRKLISLRGFHRAAEKMNKQFVDGMDASMFPPDMFSALSKTNYTAIDENGHGTHILSTAGGRFVPNANQFGLANGIAKGGAPNARLASYKVAYGEFAPYDCDVLSAFDEAIHDGVDVIFVSIGSMKKEMHYHKDSLAIGSLHAAKNGIVTAFVAGNEGPAPGSVANVAPWMLTVGSSTIDRTLVTYIELGNKQRIKGRAIFDSKLENKMYPLVSYLDVKLENATVTDVKNCSDGSISREKLQGKIIVLEQINFDPTKCSDMMKMGGAIGMILLNDPNYVLEPRADLDFVFTIPTSIIPYSDGKLIFDYIKSTKSPVAYITPVETEINSKPAPTVNAFSCRGPNIVSPDILKPDIIAPGTNILAANTPLSKHKKTKYQIMSGTSMANPHVAGLAALVKAYHPDWSPAMIKSAIMTTATTMDNTNEPIKDYTGKPATPFEMGAGQIQPNKAAHPGLVYDLKFDDYLRYLCQRKSENFTEAQLNKLADEKPFKCPTSYNLLNFNYPSITVPNLSGEVTVSRTLTNVGTPGTYEVQFIEPQGVTMTVNPTKLEFKKVGQEESYSITLKTKKAGELKDYVFGKLTWSDGMHHVTSPIVVKEILTSPKKEL